MNGPFLRIIFLMFDEKEKKVLKYWIGDLEFSISDNSKLKYSLV